jgi:hypothetical protein
MVDSRLFRHWVLTDKGDDGTMIYTPKEALSDNAHEIEQDGFELKPDGEFVKYESGSVHSRGKYEIKGDTLYTRFENQYLDSAYRVMELDDNVLKMR